MAKGWKLIGTNATDFGDTRTRVEKKRDRMRQSLAFSKNMKITNIRSYDKMIEDSDKDFNAKKSADAALLQAFADKKLKSKALIKQAQSLKKKKKSDKSEVKEDELVATS